MILYQRIPPEKRRVVVLCACSSILICWSLLLTPDFEPTTILQPVFVQPSTITTQDQQVDDFGFWQLPPIAVAPPITSTPTSQASKVASNKTTVVDTPANWQPQPLPPAQLNDSVSEPAQATAPRLRYIGQLIEQGQTTVFLEIDGQYFVIGQGEGHHPDWEIVANQAERVDVRHIPSNQIISVEKAPS